MSLLHKGVAPDPPAAWPNSDAPGGNAAPGAETANEPRGLSPCASEGGGGLRHAPPAEVAGQRQGELELSDGRG